jgi:serine/threonine protein kinase
MLEGSWSGGFTYVVEKKDSKEDFVIKTIRTEKDFSKDKFEKTILGWKNSNSLSNNIIKYYNHWYENNYLYIVTEYCENGDLGMEIEKRIRNNKKFSEEVIF